MKRRDFLLACASLALLQRADAAAALQRPARGRRQPLRYPDLPNFCAHEHWGSFDAIGTSPEGFRADTEAGAEPRWPVTVMDLVLDPYLGGWVRATGADLHAQAREAGATDTLAWWREDPVAAFAAIKPELERQQLTGAFQCLRRGIQFLHGVDIAEFQLHIWQQADSAIASAYSHIFEWYPRAMQRANFSELVRPVHPEFYLRQSNPQSASELRFTHTVMRIDPLLDFWQQENTRRDALAQVMGIEPHDAPSWRGFLTAVFDRAAANGALGTKQLQAYRRPLHFEPRDDAAVQWRGDLTPEEVQAFQDWVVHECTAQAHERGWVHQVHVGTHNLEQSSPLPLAPLARRYPNVDFVMIHCWPFIKEAGWLVKHVANCYIDTCWQPILNPVFLEESLAQWLHYAPHHKIMLSHDATSIEMAAGSALFTREILAAALERPAYAPGLSPAAQRGIAAALLHNNAVRCYRVGAEAA